MNRPACIATILWLLLQHSPANSTPPSINWTWSHRQIAHVAVNPDIPEGGWFLTFCQVQIITPVDPPAGMEAIDSYTWRINRAWDELAPVTFAFTNTAQETTQVTTTYSPHMPLDPLLHDMPVINVISEPANLWSPETGIHVFGLYDNCLQHGEEWERPAVFQYFTGSNSPVISEQIGLRINGGWSRNVDQKGLRFYFDDYGSSDSIDYDFFGNSPFSFQRLLTRTGRWPSKCFNSVFAEGLFIDLGHLGSRSSDVAIYLNNEYFGFVTLRERIDDEFIEHTHDLDGQGSCSPLVPLAGRAAWPGCPSRTVASRKKQNISILGIGKASYPGRNAGVKADFIPPGKTVAKVHVGNIFSEPAKLLKFLPFQHRLVHQHGLHSQPGVLSKDGQAR